MGWFETVGTVVWVMTALIASFGVIGFGTWLIVWGSLKVRDNIMKHFG